MITLDAIRTAMLSGDPYTEMDRLVQNELSAGRTTRQITNDFRPLIDEALETPGLTENGEESLLGVLDALTGDCHPDCHYKDPPNTTLPTEEEIAELPRWARVAFAARCARRVEILFPVYWLEAPHEARQTVQVAVELAEGAAANRHADSAHRESMLEAAIISIDAAEVVSLSEASVHAASSASAAVGAAAEVGGARHREDEPADPAATAVLMAWESLFEANVFSGREYLRRDFDHLSRLAEWQKWDDDTPVPPEVFGPLWPEGPPKGWPPVTDAPQRAELVIEAFARERATEQMIEDDIVNLFNALNRYHITRSGVRLTLEQFRSLLPAFVLAEV